MLLRNIPSISKTFNFLNLNKYEKINQLLNLHILIYLIQYTFFLRILNVFYREYRSTSL